MAHGNSPLQLEARWHGRLVAMTSVPAVGGRARCWGDVDVVHGPDGVALVNGEQRVTIDSEQPLQWHGLTWQLSRAMIAPTPGWLTERPTDATWWQIMLLAAAAHICAVAVLMLLPSPVHADGAGIPSQAKRWLSYSGGRARNVGAASVAAVGNAADAIQRLELRSPSPPLPTRRLKSARGPQAAVSDAPSADTLLAAISTTLPPGAALGSLQWWGAQAPVVGEGVGGLVLHDPLIAHQHTGTLGAGERLRRIPLSTSTTQQTPPPPDAAQTQMIATAMDTVARDSGEVVLGDDSEVDPLVHDHLARMMRSRTDAIRGCYVARVLSKHRHSEGRLVVRFHVDEQGRASQVEVDGDDDLQPAFACVRERVSTWYIGTNLVGPETALVFPFRLKPIAD
jgi:hypothetical protein